MWSETCSQIKQASDNYAKNRQSAPSTPHNHGRRIVAEIHRAGRDHHPSAGARSDHRPTLIIVGP